MCEMSAKVTAKEIRELREALGLSKPEFAAALCVSLATLYRWEGGDASLMTGIHHRLVSAIRDEIHQKIGSKNRADRLEVLASRVRSGVYSIMRMGLSA